MISIRSEPNNEERLVNINGELDIATAPRVERALRSVESGQPSRIVVDLRGVKFMDSTGLRVILAADLRARQAGRALELVRGPDNVHRIFGITGLDRRLHFVDPPA